MPRHAIRLLRDAAFTLPPRYAMPDDDASFSIDTTPPVFASMMLFFVDAAPRHAC